MTKHKPGPIGTRVRVRAEHAAKNKGLGLEDFAKLCDAELLEIPNFGKRSLHWLRTVVAPSQCKCLQCKKGTLQDRSERDRLIYEGKLSGKTFQELAREYCLETVNHVRGIVFREHWERTAPRQVIMSDRDEAKAEREAAKQKAAAKWEARMQAYGLTRERTTGR